MSIIIKNPKEIEGIRKASKLAKEALSFAGSLAKPGVSAQEIDDQVREFIRSEGGEPACLGYMGFPKSSCISLNEVVCHGIPDEQVLQAGDIASIDIAVILDGYIGDNCATFGVGKISEEAKALLDVTYECLLLGISQVSPGNTFKMIGEAIEAYATQKGYSVVEEYTGHGVGLQFHEEPHVLHYKSDRMGHEEFQPGMIFTIEPMINVGQRLIAKKPDGWTVITQDGKLSAQFEHTVMVTQDGVEILT